VVLEGSEAHVQEANAVQVANAKWVLDRMAVGQVLVASAHAKVEMAAGKILRPLALRANLRTSRTAEPRGENRVCKSNWYSTSHREQSRWLVFCNYHGSFDMFLGIRRELLWRLPIPIRLPHSQQRYFPSPSAFTDE